MQHRRAALRARQLHRRPHPPLAVGGPSALPTSRRPRAPEGDWSDTCEGACSRLRRAGRASGGAAPCSGCAGGAEACPFSTEGWTRRVQLVREGGGRGGGIKGRSILPIYGTDPLEKNPPNPRDQSLRRGGSSFKTLISPRGPSLTTRPVSYRRHSSPREEEVGGGAGGGACIDASSEASSSCTVARFSGCTSPGATSHSGPSTKSRSHARGCGIRSVRACNGKLGALCYGREPPGRGARGGGLRPPRPRKRGC